MKRKPPTSNSAATPVSVSRNSARAVWLQQTRLRVADAVAAGLTGDAASAAAVGRNCEQLTDEAIRRIEISVDRIRETGALVPLPACRSGCAACCHLPVRASIPEVVAIVDAIRRFWPAEAISDFVALARPYVDARRNGSVDAAAEPSVPCPFLTEELTCAVYAVRPIQCRVRHSFDAQACTAALTDASAEIPHNLEYATVIQPILEGIAQGTLRAGKRHETMNLIEGVLRGLETDAISRWLQNCSFVEDGSLPTG